MAPACDVCAVPLWDDDHYTRRSGDWVAVCDGCCTDCRELDAEDRVMQAGYDEIER